MGHRRPEKGEHSTSKISSRRKTPRQTKKKKMSPGRKPREKMKNMKRGACPVNSSLPAKGCLTPESKEEKHKKGAGHGKKMPQLLRSEPVKRGRGESLAYFMEETSRE